MLEQLKKEVYQANIALEQNKLITLTWGNVSGFDPASGLIVIKPSGVDYKEMTTEMMVVVDMEGNIVEGILKPSSDTPTHIELYKNFDGIASIVHTHSRYATAWAQAAQSIPSFGTTHADYFYGEVPCTRALTKEEVTLNYEKNTGLLIVEHFAKMNPLSIPAVLVASHGPFCWGETPTKAVENAIVLEEVAVMAHLTFSLGQKNQIDQFLLDKHYWRKHGEGAYYGQKKTKE